VLLAVDDFVDVAFVEPFGHRLTIALWHSLWPQMGWRLPGWRLWLRDFFVDLDRDPWKDTRVLGVTVDGRLVREIDLDVTTSLTVGSGHECHIRLPSGPAIAAELNVGADHDGVSFVPYWPDGRGGADRDEKARVPLNVGNTIEVSGCSLEIVDPRPLDERLHKFRSRWARYFVRVWTWFVPIEEWHPRQRRILGVDFARIIGGGFDQRDELLGRLGAIAYEEEAAVAERQFTKGRRAFVCCTLAFAIVCVSVINSVPVLGDSSAGAGAALVLLTMLVCSIVSSAYGAAGASLYFAVGGALVGSMASRLEGPGMPLADTVFAFLYGIIGAVLGYQVEAAWFPVPNTVRATQSGAIGLMLVAFALMAPWEDASRLEQLTRGAIAALVIGWITIGLPLLRRRLLERTFSPGRDNVVTGQTARRLTPDSLVLLDAAWFFWRRQMLFRIVAVLLAAAPVIGLLNAFVAEERLAAHRVMIADDLAFVWSDPQGRDLIPAGVYVIPDLWWRTWEIRPDRTSLPGHRVTLDRKSTEYAALSKYRVAGPPALRTLLDERSSDSPAELWCEERPATPTISTAAHLSRCYMTRADEEWMEQLMALVTALRPAAAVLTAFALLVMWRAPGERGSVAAALWAFGYASALGLVVPVTGAVNLTSLDALVMQWGLSARSDSALVQHVYVVLRGLMFFAVILGILAVSGILGTGVIVARTWPSHRLASGRWSLPSVAARVAVTVLAPATLFVATYYLIGLFRGPWNTAFTAAVFIWVGSIPIIAPLVLAWALRRYQTRRGLIPPVPRHGESNDAVGWTHVTVLVIPPLMAALAWAAILWRVPQLWLFGGAAVLTAALIMCLGHVVFWRRLWKLAGGRTVAAAVTVMVLPLTTPAIETVGEELVEDLALFPAPAMQFLAIMATLAISRPLYQLVRTLFEKLTVAEHVRKAVAGVPVLIERLLSTPAASAETLRDLLEHDLGVRRYAFFTRTGSRSFVPMLVAPDLKVPAALSLSPELLRRFGGVTDFLNLHLAVYDVKFVTVAPELWRLDRQLRRQLAYALPVNIGGVLCALLLVGEDPLPESFRAESVVERIHAISAASAKFLRG
jgi:hypothetical protein